MRLQPLLPSGSTIAVILGVAISLFSLNGINESSAVNQYIPALDSFDISSSSVAKIATLRPAKGDLIGTLDIPRIKRVIPIYEGTDDAELKRGAGHYIKSVMPGAIDNSVIAGHRDSVFSKFGSLKIGDPLTVKTASGTFTYKIKSFRIVKADDRTVIVPTKVATLTLSTCYPFYYVGNAPKRFIVTALLNS
jgi:sortase A